MNWYGAESALLAVIGIYAASEVLADLLIRGSDN